MTFNQQDEAQKLLQTLARLTLPHETQDQDAILQAIDDAAALYGLIEQARDILKGRTS